MEIEISKEEVMGIIAEKGDLVTLHLTGRLSDGEMFTSFIEDGPFEFTIGDNQVLIGLSHAVMGMQEGQSKTVDFTPEDAFGEYNEELIYRVNLSDLPEELEVGESFTIEGDERLWTVQEIDEDTSEAILDGNHMLAGEAISFDIKLVKIVKSASLNN